VQPGEAELLARRISDALAEPFVLAEGVVAEVGGSVGIGVARATDGPDDVLGRADGAMYRAKGAGGSSHGRAGARPEPVAG
jgi:GGDEF domain-containing protein